MFQSVRTNCGVIKITKNYQKPAESITAYKTRTANGSNSTKSLVGNLSLLLRLRLFDSESPRISDTISNVTPEQLREPLSS